MTTYSLPDVVRAYDWLGHRGHGYTELNAIRPVAGGRRVVVDYVTSLAGVVQFVREHASTSLCLLGLNPRPVICARPDGRLRSATSNDIAEVQSLIIDVDLAGPVTPVRIERLSGFL